MFKSFTIVNPNFVVIEMQKMIVELKNLPVAGLSVLDISKTILYEGFFDVIRKTYGMQAKLIYADTDSVMCNLVQDLSLRNKNGTPVLMPCFFKFIKDHQEIFDTSNFKPGNKFNVPLCNKSALKCWKDELAGSCATYAIALTSKSYAVEIEDKDTYEKRKIIKLKGICKRVSKQLNPSDFKEVLHIREIRMNKMSRIMCKNNELYTIIYKKKSLNYENSRRVFLPGDFSKSYAPGHYKTM